MPEVETFDKPYDIGFMVGSNNTLGRDSTFFIPDEFLYNSKKVRSKVLAGILDAKTKPKRGIIDKRKERCEAFMLRFVETNSKKFWND